MALQYKMKRKKESVSLVPPWRSSPVAVGQQTLGHTEDVLGKSSSTTAKTENNSGNGQTEKTTKKKQNKPYFPTCLQTMRLSSEYKTFYKSLDLSLDESLVFHNCCSCTHAWMKVMYLKKNKARKTPTFRQTKTKSVCAAAKAGSQSGAELR